MDAKTELERRLVGLAPGMETEIRQVLEAYRITWAETGGALALRERIESFLAAKRIDGLSPKTLKDYGLVLRSFARNVDRPPGGDHRRRCPAVSGRTVGARAEEREHRHPRQHAAELFRMAGAGGRDREKPHAEDQEPERGPGRRLAAL